LIKSGFEVHVLAVGRAGLAERETTDGIHVHRFRSSATKTIRRGVNLTALRAFAAYVSGSVQWTRKHRPSLIHYNDWNTLFIGPLARVKHRAIYDMHELFQDLDYLDFPWPINGTIAAIDRGGLRRAEAVICVSKPIQQELQALTHRPVYVVRNVPEARFAHGPGNASLVAYLRDGRKHLVFLGALLKDTGALYMLQLLKHLPSEFVLDCFSQQTDKNAFFIEEAARLQLSQRVQIFDYLPHTELCATIRHAFAGVSCLVPSSRKLEYALPNKLFEYFLAGLPVITSNARAQAELVTESGLGLVADLDDAPGAARRIASWTPPAVTPALVEKHGLTWEHEERELARVYRELHVVS
jgi:glycosyltransferase involved in cell wall biosynthesis